MQKMNNTWINPLNTMYLQMSLCKLPYLLSRIANIYVSEAKAREIDDFLCDVTCMRKFDYYSADHTLWGSHMSQM